MAWLLSACVGQLQFDPIVGGGVGGSRQPSAGSGGSTGAGPMPGTGGSTTTPGTGGSTMSVGDAGAAETPVQASCPTGFDVLTTVFKNKCGGCHGAAAPTKNLDLVTAGLGTRTVGAPSTCNNRQLVSTTVIGGVAGGHLLDKLAGPVAGCGVQMPAGGTPLSDVEMACVKEWALKAIQASGAGEYP
jgi:hypothetical protein